jgi:DNA-binding response OmpR family regulator
MMRVLHVDPDTDLLDITGYALRREGFFVFSAPTAERALALCAAEQVDIVVLEANLPRRDGFDVCRQIRAEYDLPVIFLTGLAAEEDTLRGYRAGADDYVTKPFSVKVLAQRLRIAARRAGSRAVPDSAPLLRLGELEFDFEEYEVRLGRAAIQLTRIQCRLLRALVSNAGRVVPSSRLAEQAWDFDDGDVGQLKTHICHIRQKLNSLQTGAIEITSVPGVGYRCSAPKPKLTPVS